MVRRSQSKLCIVVLKCLATITTALSSLAVAPANAEVGGTSSTAGCGSGAKCVSNSGAKPQGSPRSVSRPAITAAVPQVSGRSAYVSQIGEDNQVTLRQSGEAQADVQQFGFANSARITQSAISEVRASLSQIGGENVALLDQTGAGSAMLIVQQNGRSNSAVALQNGDNAYNAAQLTQAGDGNSVVLTQYGSSNEAALSQFGNSNRMSVEQSGSGNSLEWAQVGNNLSAPTVSQSGGSSMQITQMGW